MNNDAIAFILGQTFGILAIICTVASMQFKKRRPLMIIQTASEALIVSQYLVKGAITGALLGTVSFVRDIIFTKYDDKHRAPLWILLVLYVIMTILTTISWAGPLSILPYIGALIYSWSLWYGQVKWIRIGNAVGNSPYLVYTILTGNYALFAMTLLEIISSMIGFIRHDIQKSKSKH